MDVNSKKLERTSKFVNFVISLTLCIFLILLSGKIIGDLNRAVKSPDMDDFKDLVLLSQLNAQSAKYSSEIEALDQKKETIERGMRVARDNYKNEKESFENWLKTRRTLGSPDKDKEVTDRAGRLDAFYEVEHAWKEQLSVIQAQIDAIDKNRRSVYDSASVHNAQAQEKYYAALKTYRLKVFLVRLLFVLPILGIGVYFFIRHRQHKFYPLFFGFTLFSVYTFFFGLLPYIPSYGGYVRYSVGVLLTVGLGYYAIKHIKSFMEQKQAELKASAQERAKKVQTDTAEKALANHFCPSCGKDFFMKNWEVAQVKNTAGATNSLITDFCRHCGMELFKKCESCGGRNFAHFPFCSSCGAKITVK
ncbi:MAG: hypothetical protein LBQ47_03415 [Endomicrobium sp.]|jgi:Tfp pilus assembly protein PilE|nr:hypothetical protein [Endomicrobium sp.]